VTGYELNDQQGHGFLCSPRSSVSEELLMGPSMSCSLSVYRVYRRTCMTRGHLQSNENLLLLNLFLSLFLFLLFLLLLLFLMFLLLLGVLSPGWTPHCLYHLRLDHPGRLGLLPRGSATNGAKPLRGTHR
jgi:hypothetical protein